MLIPCPVFHAQVEFHHPECALKHDPNTPLFPCDG
ncbi:Uncharacterised protein [Vibrio cholerae]|nr:Uncharacterised protein [Vibrio cholerae]